MNATKSLIGHALVYYNKLSKVFKTITIKITIGFTFPIVIFILVVQLLWYSYCGIVMAKIVMAKIVIHAFGYLTYTLVPV